MPTTTPIVPGYHPDPSVVRVGDAYWLANSSFEYLPGVPIRYSEDLIHWELVGHAFERPDDLPLDGDEPSLGTYAPTLRHHDGLFWLIVTNVGPFARGQLIVHTEDPRTGWSRPVVVPDTPGIDPDLAWDEEGRCHMTWRRLGPELVDGTEIRSVVIDPATGERLGEETRLWQGTGTMTDPEGPHLYRKDGWWYLLLAEGGTHAGHSVTIARARTLEGPWEPSPSNPVLTHRSSHEPVQATGHGDLVVAPDGRWAMVHLGTRPRGGISGFHVNGRETFLVGVDWDEEGWPHVDEERYRVPRQDQSFTDDLRGRPGPVADGDEPWDLGPRWVSPGGLVRPALSRDEDGRLRISALPVHERYGTPLLAVRCVDEWWRAEATVEVADGVVELAVGIDRDFDVAVRASTGEQGAVVSARANVGELRTEHACATAPAGPLTLWLRAERPERVPFRRTGPDELVLGYRGAEGEDVELAVIDGRYVSTELASGFTGRVVGLRALEGSAVVESFTYTSEE